MTRPGTPLPEVAPHESCVACLKGDTTTGLVIKGSAPWIQVGLMKMGISEDEAWALVSTIAEENYGAPPGKAPMSMHAVFRVCADCAAKAGLQVSPVGGTMVMYSQTQRP